MDAPSETGEPLFWFAHVAPLSAEENLVSEDCSLRDAVRAINVGPAHVALVTSSHGRLLGTVTDGDVRRALLSGQELDSSVRNALSPDFKSLTMSASARDALKLMRSESLHQVPVLDTGGRVTGIYVIDYLDPSEDLPNTVVIMAGGEGLRLRPLTGHTPKALLPVGHRPMLEIIINQCADAGLRNFVISVNYLKQQIMEFAGDGSRFGVNISYIEESEPMGTAGSLSLLKDTGDHPIIVMNGDVLTRVNFRHLVNSHLQSRAHATVCARRYETPVPFGILQMEGSDIVGVEEKPVLAHMVNAGIYVLHPSLVDLIPRGAHLDMTELLHLALQNGKQIKAFALHEYWLDVGLPETLRQADTEWLAERLPNDST